MKVLVATDKPFAKVAVDGIRKEIEAAGYELVLLEKYGEKAKLLEAVKDANAIIIRSDIIDAEVLDAAKELKIVVRAGAGYDNVDLEAATAHNVCVMNTPGQNSNAVAELAFGLMVMAVRNMYNGTSGTELMGKKLGIHAYGNVGRNVARIAKGFGMEIYAFDAFCPKEVIEKDGVKAVGSAEELYSTCDVVSLHIPATAETKNSINYALVNKMPKGGLLVNTARKEVINEAELIQLMEERPTGSRHYPHLPRNDLLQHILKSLATGTGLETYLFVSQQNTDDSRLHLPVLPFPGIVSCGNGADRHGIFYSFAGFGRFRSGVLYVVLNRFNIRSRFC